MLSFWRNNYDFTMIYANALWIHYYFIIFSRMYYERTIYSAFDYEVIINFIIDFEFTIYFANWLWIDYKRFDYDYLSREFTTHTLIRDMAMTLLSISWFDYEFIIYFAIWLWNQCAFNEISINALSFSQIYFEFNMFFVNSLWIYYGYRPQMITILISRRNADSKLVNWIYFVSSTRFSLIRQVWPYFDPWWSLIAQIDLE